MKITKLIFAIFCLLILSLSTSAAAPLSTISIVPKFDAASSSTPADNEKLKLLQMQRFSKMTIADYEKLKGKKLNFFEKLSFQLTQHRINKMLKRYQYGDGPSVLQKISWLLKGILLGPIALLLGYIFLKDDERELIKWIWFGFAGFLIIVGVILFA